MIHTCTPPNVKQLNTLQINNYYLQLMHHNNQVCAKVCIDFKCKTNNTRRPNEKLCS